MSLFRRVVCALMERRELIDTNVRLARDNTRLLYERDDAYDLAACLRADVEEMAHREAGWRRRAEALADVVDPELVQGIFGVLSTVESLPETEVR